MAHTCPDCGQYCNCNGDIDDICLDLPEDAMNCTHCLDEYGVDYDDEDRDDWREVFEDNYIKP